jgi:hypothetical protein
VSEPDWLTIPEEDSRAEKNPDFIGRVLAMAVQEQRAAVAVVDEVAKSLPAVIAPRDVTEPPVDAGRRAKMLDKAWNKLNKKQKVYLTLLRENRFNQRATDRLLALTPDKVSRTTVRNWINLNEDFAFVLKVMKTVEAGASIDRERLLLRAEEIADSALEPTPILYQGMPTGFYENYKDTALRANEQLMKAAGMLKGDEKTQRVVVRVVNLAGPEDPTPPKQVIDVGAEVIE